MDLIINIGVSFIGLYVRIFSFLIIVKPLRVYLGLVPLKILSTVLSLWLFKIDPNLNNLNSVIDSNIFFFLFANLAIGLAFGLPLALFAQYFPMCGRMIDVVRGVQFSEQILPGGSGRTSILEQGAVLLIPFFIFVCGGYTELTNLMLIMSKIDLSQGVKFSELLDIGVIIQFTYDILRSSLIICTPCIITCFITDLSFALVSRSLGRINMVFETMPIKVVGGLFIVWIMLQTVSSESIYPLWENAKNVCPLTNLGQSGD